MKSASTDQGFYFYFFNFKFIILFLLGGESLQFCGFYGLAISSSSFLEFQFFKSKIFQMFLSPESEN